MVLKCKIYYYIDRKLQFVFKCEETPLWYFLLFKGEQFELLRRLLLYAEAGDIMGTEPGIKGLIFCLLRCLDIDSVTAVCVCVW
jgi:hypothetical protein